MASPKEVKICVFWPVPSRTFVVAKRGHVTVVDNSVKSTKGFPRICKHKAVNRSTRKNEEITGAQILGTIRSRLNHCVVDFCMSYGAKMIHKYNTREKVSKSQQKDEKRGFLGPSVSDMFERSPTDMSFCQFQTTYAPKQDNAKRGEGLGWGMSGSRSSLNPNPQRQ